MGDSEIQTEVQAFQRNFGDGIVFGVVWLAVLPVWVFTGSLLQLFSANAYVHSGVLAGIPMSVISVALMWYFTRWISRRLTTSGRYWPLALFGGVGFFAVFLQTLLATSWVSEDVGPLYGLLFLVTVIAPMVIGIRAFFRLRGSVDG